MSSHQEEASHSAPKKDGRYCRVCHDFQTWMKKGLGSKGGLKVEETAPPPKKNDKSDPDTRPEDCPPDQVALGRASWPLLHSIPVTYPGKACETRQQFMLEFLESFAKYYPCRPCGKDMTRDLKENPPRTESADELAQWMCEMHNRVNKKLGKPQFDCQLVDQRWKDGWEDGRCG